MQDIPSATYEGFSIELRDVRYTYIPKREGTCIIFEADSHEFVELLENADELLVEDVFRSIQPDRQDMYNCIICNENECNLRYNATWMTMHSGDCREEFTQRIRMFLVEHSQTVMEEAI